MLSGGDSRVLSVEGQDAMMVDSGGGGRPPGDPPDVARSWAEKVKGSMAGGRPRPEEVVDEAFVRERLSLDFPNGEDGEAELTIGDEVLEAMNGLWKRCMIVKVLGRSVPIAMLSRRLRELWKPSGGMYVLDLPRQFFIVRFEKEEEYLAALTQGPWRVFGSYLMVQAWSPEFDPVNDEIITMPVWVRVSNLSVNFYHNSILTEVARGLGKPVKVDGATLQFERARFARLCVEVNFKKPLKGSILINGDRYFVAYEGLTNICSLCGLYGHLVHNCPEGVQVNGTVQGSAIVLTQASGSLGEPAEEGFTRARSAGRRTGIRMHKGGAQTESGRGDGEGSRRGNWRRKYTEDIAVSNKFGNLEEEMEVADVGDELVKEGANKENQTENILNQSRDERSDTQEKAIVFGASLGNVGKGPRNGGKVGKNVPNKGSLNGGPKPKQPRASRPIMGLVFGPNRGEEDVSVNGKRLRVEVRNVGRPGGSFSSNREQRSDEMRQEMVSAIGEDVAKQGVGGGVLSTEGVVSNRPSGIETETRFD